jgi:hypothetical protein
VTELNTASTPLDSICLGPVRPRLLAASILEQWARFSAFARFQAASSRARQQLAQSRAALADLGGTGTADSAGRAEDGAWVNRALWPGSTFEPSPAPAGIGATGSSPPSLPGRVEAARNALVSGATGVNDWDAAVRGIELQDAADSGDGPDAFAVAALLTAALSLINSASSTCDLTGVAAADATPVPVAPAEEGPLAMHVGPVEERALALSLAVLRHYAGYTGRSGGDAAGASESAESAAGPPSVDAASRRRHWDDLDVVVLAAAVLLPPP